MSAREYYLLGNRVRMAMTASEDADVVLSWRPLEGYVPVIMAKKRCFSREVEGLIVRDAVEGDMPAIRGLYAMTAGRAMLLPVRDGLWTADGALVAEKNGRAAAYCLGGDMNGVWNIHEWGIDPETDTVAAASAFALHNNCRRYQIRAEFAPSEGMFGTGECLYIGVPKPFLLGTQMVENAQQLAEMIEAAQRA